MSHCITSFVYHKCFHLLYNSSERKTQSAEFQLDPTVMKSTSSSSKVIYEEMADPPSAFNCTQCPTYETTTEVVKHDYEEVKLYGNLDIHTTHEAYQLTKCSAYGVPVQSTTSS